MFIKISFHLSYSLLFAFFTFSSLYASDEMSDAMEVEPSGFCQLTSLRHDISTSRKRPAQPTDDEPVAVRRKIDVERTDVLYWFRSIHFDRLSLEKELQAEVLELIAQFLDLKDLKSLRQTCKTFRNLINYSPTLDFSRNGVFYFDRANVYDYVVGRGQNDESLKVQHAHFREIDSWQTEPTSISPDDFAACFAHEICSLRVSENVDFSPTNLSFLRSFGAGLKSLECNNESISSEGEDCLVTLIGLRHLSLPFYPWGTLDPIAGLVSLEYLDISSIESNASLKPLENLIRLKKLYIWSLRGVNIESVGTLEGLELLGIRYMDLNPAETMNGILNNLRQLKHLIIDNADMENDEEYLLTLMLPRLQKLELRRDAWWYQFHFLAPPMEQLEVVADFEMDEQNVTFE